MNSGTSGYIYTFDKLSFAYNGSAANALTNINLNIEAGSFVILCGPSGCGKTTLLRHMKPAMLPHGSMEGNVYYKGNDIKLTDDREQAQDIGYVFQEPDAGIATDMVWTELAFGPESLGLDNTVIRQRVADTAAYFGLQDIYEEKTSELSGGGKQLISLASVMVMNPSVLILDEPVSQLDPVSSSHFIELLGRINRENGTTIVVSAHRLEELMPVSTHIVVMKDGSIIKSYVNEEYSVMADECSEELEEALPAAAKIYLNAGSKGRCPFSVAEGRRWLEDNDVMKNIITTDESAGSVTDSVPVVKAAASITAKGLYYSYKGSGHDIIKNADFCLMEGEVYSVLGANGSGKSTLLSLLSGIIKPDHGRINIADGKRVVLLPQNPELLFEKDTVRADLELTGRLFDNKEQWQELKEDVIKICNLNNILDCDPYNISGGERQRVALAKIIMSDADIILMDEPSKGMDAAGRHVLAEIINDLAKLGKSILIVSHDIEFAAMCSDRSGILFDGSITASNTTREFMLNNRYYTTAVVKITRGIIDGCVTIEDICGDRGRIPIKKNDSSVSVRVKDALYRKDRPVKQKCSAGCAFAPLFFNLIPWLVYAFVIPVTIWFGMSVLQDRKYYFIALLIILESFVPFYVSFERKGYSSRVLVSVAVLSATAVASRVAFYMLPGIKPMAAIVIIAGIALGGEPGFVIGSLSMLVSNIFFGQGSWTPWQMFAMGLVGLIAGSVFHRYRYNVNRYILAITGAVVTIAVYGGIVNFSTLVTVRGDITAEVFAATYIAGLPFDVMHGIVTAVLLWLLAKPMLKKILRIL